MHFTRRQAIQEPFEQVPLIIGVVGHIHIWPEHRERLKREISDVIEDYRSQTRYFQTPIVLLTSLAEGSDRLAAEVVCAWKEKDPQTAEAGGVYLAAVLPMEQAEYEKDFQTEESVAEFRACLAVAAVTWTLDWSKECPPDRAHEQACRDKQYEAVGKFLADNSHVLIALWDGQETTFVAGTSAVRRLRDNAIREAARRLQRYDPCGYGPLIHVVTPRRETGKELEGAFKRIEHPPFSEPREGAEPAHEHGHDEEEYTHHERIYRAFETFNQDVEKLSAEPGMAEAVKSSADDLFRDGEDRELTKAELPPPLAWLRRLYATADVLAMRFQKQADSSLRLMIAFAALAGITLDLYHGFHSVLLGSVEPNPAVLLAAQAFGLTFLASGLIVLGTLLRSLRRQDQDRYLAYRSLAESLRVQFFWKLSGVGQTVALHFRGRDFRELDWIRSAADVAWRLTGTGLAQARPGGDWRNWRNCIDARWVDYQFKWFAKALTRERKRLHRHENAIGLSLRLAGWMMLLCGTLAVLPICGIDVPPRLFLAVIFASLFLSTSLVAINVFICLRGGEAPPREGESGFAYALRVPFEKMLALFEGLMGVPSVKRQEKPKKTLERWTQFGFSAARLAMVLFILTLVAAQTPWLKEHTPSGGHEEHSSALADEEARLHLKHVAHWTEFWSISSVGFLLLAAGYFHFRAYRHAYEAHVASYETMLNVFGEARRRVLQERNEASDLPLPTELKPVNADTETQDVLKALGADALSENSDWVVTHHSRPLEPMLG